MEKLTNRLVCALACWSASESPRLIASWICKEHFVINFVFHVLQIIETISQQNCLKAVDFDTRFKYVIFWIIRLL